MRNLFIKKGFFAVVALFLVLLVFLIIRLVFAVNASQQSSGFLTKTMFANGSEPYDNASETLQLTKQVFLLEQKLELAKSDSISLAIDLSDSLVQIQLEGLDLFHTKILHQHPRNFLNPGNLKTHRHLAMVTEIESEVANVPKRPVKKVKAPKIGIPVSETKIQTDTIPNPELIWQFTTENNIRVVITGVKMALDSTFKFQPQKDLLQYKTFDFLNEIIPEEYSPVVYLWVNDSEAKSIFRAVPEKGKVLFSN
jgi:hypothetical protein